MTYFIIGLLDEYFFLRVKRLEKNYILFHVKAKSIPIRDKSLLYKKTLKEKDRRAQDPMPFHDVTLRPARGVLFFVMVL